MPTRGPEGWPSVPSPPSPTSVEDGKKHNAKPGWMTAMNTVLLFIVVLGPLIFFHEFGHFLMAKLFGVGVERFSLGFGPRLIGKKIGRTDYRLSLIPLGGYVKMVGEEPDAELPPEDLPFSFTHKHVLKRSLIVFAGPFFNALLALMVFFSISYFHGIDTIIPVIREIDANSPAEQAGIHRNDRIVAIDGTPVASWYDINAILDANTGAPIHLDIVRNQTPMRIGLTPKKDATTDLYGNKVTYYSFGISGMAKPLPIIGKVEKKMPAFAAGLKAGDRIVSIDGQPIEYWEQMHKIIADSKGKTVHVDVQRQSETLAFDIAPRMVKDRNLLGISSKNFRIGIAPTDLVPDSDKMTVSLDLGESLKHGVGYFGQVTSAFIDFLKNAVRGNVSRKLVGGPIRIAFMAQQSAHMGMTQLFFFVAAISLQLGLLNLLPIPVLDGGHLLFYGIEAIKRGPLSVQARERAQQVGLFLLLLLMVFVICNDIELSWFN
jgi:regulator of sigma E protease